MVLIRDDAAQSPDSFMSFEGATEWRVETRPMLLRARDSRYGRHSLTGWRRKMRVGELHRPHGAGFVRFRHELIVSTPS